MTLAHIKNVLKEYSSLLGQKFYKVHAVDDYESMNDDRTTQFEHTRWMAEKAQEFCDNGEDGKANRWLGFIQGVLYAHGLRSIADMRTDNRNNDEEKRSLNFSLPLSKWRFVDTETGEVWQHDMGNNFCHANNISFEVKNDD